MGFSERQLSLVRQVETHMSWCVNIGKVLEWEKLKQWIKRSLQIKGSPIKAVIVVTNKNNLSFLLSPYYVPDIFYMLHIYELKPNPHNISMK